MCANLGEIMRKKMVPFFLVLLIVYLLHFFSVKTQLYQDLLILESNGLFTTNHIIANKQLIELWENERTDLSDIYAYCIVEKNVDKTVMAIYANDFHNIYLPINHGRMIDDYGYNQAIVGTNINTFYQDGFEYYEYDNEQYKVVGKLGISTNSPLENYIIINNLSYFANNDNEIIFCGDGVNKLNLASAKVNINRGIDRWLNIATYSSFIAYTSYLIMIISVGLSGLFFVINTKEERYLKYQFGVSKLKIIFHDIKMLTYVSLLLSFLSFLASQQGFYKLDVTVMTKNYVIAYVILIISYAIFVRKQNLEIFI
jgi:hypothetical protein